jgi:hypothetical protein
VRPARYAIIVLATYQEIRDWIYECARAAGLRPDWVESTRFVRLLLLYDREHKVVARVAVPVRRIRPLAIADLEHRLEGVFGKDWLK